ncbi:hypothetical protein GCM10027020_14700 [Nocardioides salsibiostraticola]
MTALEAINEVRLLGRVSLDPEERILPSGDRLWTFRLVVARSEDETRTSRTSVDALECAVWGGRPRRSVASWRGGDIVEVEGALRRRFFRHAGGTSSRVEIEVSGARLVRRRGTG